MRRGFTLIELLIVLCIVGIILAIAIPNLALAIKNKTGQDPAPVILMWAAITFLAGALVAGIVALAWRFSPSRRRRQAKRHEAYRRPW